MKRRNHIVVVEPSIIIRGGMVQVLKRISNLDIDIAECAYMTEVSSKTNDKSPDIIIINPTYIGSLSALKQGDIYSKTKFIALQHTILDSTLLKEYDGVISISDTIATISATLATLENKDDFDNEKIELSIREQEVVACIAKGMSNKQIADHLFLSTHTIMTHRRNISNKLQIHSPAGLTIYAIVNNIISVNEMKDSISSIE